MLRCWIAGGDVEKLGHFQTGKRRSHDSIFFASPLGGDVEKRGHFQSGKSRSHGSIFLHHLLGAILIKFAIFKWKNCFGWVQQFFNRTFNNMGDF